MDSTVPYTSADISTIVETERMDGSKSETPLRSSGRNEEESSSSDHSDDS
jgi:hypothetical protein